MGFAKVRYRNSPLDMAIIQGAILAVVKRHLLTFVCAKKVC
jgi:hypothetical protein